MERKNAIKCKKGDFIVYIKKPTIRMMDNIYKSGRMTKYVCAVMRSSYSIEEDYLYFLAGYVYNNQVNLRFKKVLDECLIGENEMIYKNLTPWLYKVKKKYEETGFLDEDEINYYLGE